MSKKAKKFEINRKEYKEVKRMDHNQMQQWAADIYDLGFNAGASTVSEDNENLTIDKVREILLSAKGFGEKRVAAICEVLEQKLNY